MSEHVCVRACVCVCLDMQAGFVSVFMDVLVEAGSERWIAAHLSNADVGSFKSFLSSELSGPRNSAGFLSSQ